MDTYPVTPKAVGSNRFKLEIQGAPVFVHKFKDIHYAHFPHPDTHGAKLTVVARRPFTTAELSPQSAGIRLHADPSSLTCEFHMEEPGKLVFTLDGRERLFVFADDGAIESASENGPSTDISILDYGADPSGKSLSTWAIQKAIDSAPPGSSVRIPHGHYLSGSVLMKSDLTLLLDPGALLQASPRPGDFESLQNAFIVIQDAENVTLRGGGTIDGSGAFLRHLTDESGRLLAVRDSRNVTIEGVILRNPRGWNTHLIRSEHVTLRNVKLLNDRHVSNTDGINPDSSRHVLIEDVFFYCGDDAVAVKSTDRDGRFDDVSDITVRNNVILTKKSALKVGTETHAKEMKNILFADNEVIECDRGMSIYARDGAQIHSVRFLRNRFQQHYPDYQQKLIHFQIKERGGLSRVSDILIQDCTAAQRWPQRSSISGLAEGYGVYNVRFVNYRYGGNLCRSPADADLELGPHVGDVKFEVSIE